MSHRLSHRLRHHRWRHHFLELVRLTNDVSRNQSTWYNSGMPSMNNITWCWSCDMIPHWVSLIDIYVSCVCVCHKCDETPICSLFVPVRVFLGTVPPFHAYAFLRSSMVLVRISFDIFFCVITSFDISLTQLVHRSISTSRAFKNGDS